MIINILADFRSNLEKVGGVFNIRFCRNGYAGVYMWDISYNYVFDFLFIIIEIWNKEIG